MSNPDAIKIATTCLEAWSSGDVATARSVLGHDVTYDGPLGTAGGVEASLAELAAVATHVKSVEPRKVLANGGDVCIMYDLVTESAGVVPTSDWYHVEDGKIDSVQACFDARPLAAAAAPAPVPGVPKVPRSAVAWLVPSCVTAEMEIAAWGT